MTLTLTLPLVEICYKLTFILNFLETKTSRSLYKNKKETCCPVLGINEDKFDMASITNMC